MASSFLSAQEKIKVKAGDDFSETLASFGIYRFPSFISSDIFFRNGAQSSAKLNYNLAVGEIQFIDDKSDTLSIANPEELRVIKIDTVLFYYNQKYMEVVAGNVDELKLAFWQKIKIDFEELGAYDRPANGVDVKSYKNYTSPQGSTVYDLKANQNRIITKEASYFLIDKYGTSFSATKNNFIHFFPAKRVVIQDYLKENKVDFGKIADLKKLFKFCSEQH